MGRVPNLLILRSGLSGRVPKDETKPTAAETLGSSRTLPAAPSRLPRCCSSREGMGTARRAIKRGTGNVMGGD